MNRPSAPRAAGFPLSRERTAGGYQGSYAGCAFALTWSNCSTIAAEGGDVRSVAAMPAGIAAGEAGRRRDGHVEHPPRTSGTEMPDGHGRPPPR